MKKANRIFAFHLLNDRSGSPKVLSQLIIEWVKEGYEAHLYTSKNQQGFLSDLTNVKYHNGWYRFKPNPWLRLVYFFLSQLILFYRMWNQIKKTDIVYVNTVLPFGAAILGKIKGCRVIYHIHESTVNPPILKWFLFAVVKITASDIINVSVFVGMSHGIINVRNHLVYNSLEQSYLEKVLPKEDDKKLSNVLMVCSMKVYKGIWEFLKLAEDNPDYSFYLVVSASQKQIDAFFNGKVLSGNLTIYPSQSNLHPFFRWADIIVNLSRPDGWIETFGLTIIEGMAYGLPAIVPSAGGILEVIEEGKTGFSVDCRDTQKLNNRLKMLMDDADFYRSCAKAARKRLMLFNEKIMHKRVHEILISEV
jgi:L-malate glycosyltransferase